MPKASAAKTASAPKQLALAALGVILLVVLPAWYLGRYDRALYLSGRAYSLEIADTEASRVKGLGGRASLPADHAMLFIFESAAVHCFWMKDTLIPLDMVWLDAKHQVVHIENNVLPETFPKSFCPSQPAKYVLEFSAGTAAATGLKTGDRLSL